VRKFVFILFALVLALGAAACGSSSKSSSGSTNTTVAPPTATTTPQPPPQPISCNGTPASVSEVGQASDFKPVTADTLTVVTSLPGPGFWEGSDSDPTKVTSGYEYDIANKMKDAFGLHKLVVRNESFDAIVAGTVKDYDLALSQISITCDRAKVVKFSQPYFFSNQGILVKKGFDKPIATVADAQKLLWGVQASTTAIDLLNKIKPTQQPHQYTQLADGYTALQAGQVDAFLIDTAINLGEAARSNGVLEVPAQFLQPGGPDQYGAILPKDSVNGPAINAVIKQLQDSGQLAELATKDLTANPATLPSIAVP
jgi:polar amino acid transport system substrate-binding protein